MTSLVYELIRFVIARRKYWLLPVLLVSLMIGSLLIASNGSVIAPLIYTIF